MPHDLITAKPVMAAIREFFGSSQLSQFMDQTNPLGDHAQAASLALGPGGLSRERGLKSATSTTHYGRICRRDPKVRTTGFISTLSLRRINEFGSSSRRMRGEDGR
jgi:DNA-directed RNA polymerase subunit beta